MSRKIWLLPLFGILLALLSLLSTTPVDATTHIVFRYDDFYADAPGTREKDALREQVWKAEQEVDSLFAEYGFRYTIAIIPSLGGVALGADAGKSQFIKDAVSSGRVEVAQHGFAHINWAGADHRAGEFRERDYLSQLNDIKQGRESLLAALGIEGIEVFVPPWHGWTDDTAKIIKTLGFKILSADSYYCYDSAEGLTVIPHMGAGLADLELLIAEGRLPNPGIVVILYHPVDIVVSPSGEGRYFSIERFGRLLSALAASPGVSVETLSRLRDECGDLTVHRFRLANSLSRYRAFWRKLLLPGLLPAEKPVFYLSASEYSKMLRPWYYCTGAFILVLVAAGFLVRRLLACRLSAKWRVAMDILVIILSCMSVVAELRLLQRGYHITAIRLIPALLAAGFFLGWLEEMVKKRVCRTGIASAE